MTESRPTAEHLDHIVEQGLQEGTPTEQLLGLVVKMGNNEEVFVPEEVRTYVETQGSPSEREALQVLDQEVVQSQWKTESDLASIKNADEEERRSKIKELRKGLLSQMTTRSIDRDAQVGDHDNRVQQPS